MIIIDATKEETACTTNIVRPPPMVFACSNTKSPIIGMRNRKKKWIM